MVEPPARDGPLISLPAGARRVCWRVMGFFDRFTGKKSAPSSPAQTPAPAPAQAAPTAQPTVAPAATPVEPASERPATAGGVLPQLTAARAKLAARDLAGAMAIYETVLASAGDRADVLLTISADLGTHGHVRELIDLIAPRYVAERHGHGPGVNLLQAYLAVREPEPAQHVLDLLFALNRPDLENRLIGFSRAIGELDLADAAAPEIPKGASEISLVSISKPIWFYGLDAQAAALLPRKEGRLRRVAFAQCALLGGDNVLERAKQPEDATGRFSRGLALWLAETFFYSAGYEPFAGVGVFAPEHYALFPQEWTPENIRQLNDSTEGGFDYVVTTALKGRHDDFELTLRIWEVKKFRQLKSFSTRWTPSTTDAALAAFHQQIRTYMEWAALPAGNGLAYSAPEAPGRYVQALGGSLGLFLHGKGMLPTAHVPTSADLFLENARAHPQDARAQLLLVTALQRLQVAGQTPSAEAMAHAKSWLATDAARAIGLAPESV